MVTRKYKDYCPEGSFQFCSNDAFRGIRLMDSFKDSIIFDSFILGSSRSDFYYIEEWKKYVGDSIQGFHFNQSGDNLLGLSQRIDYLYKRFPHINNVLIIVDHELLESVTSLKGPLFIAPYQVTKENDYLRFHWEFIKTFFSVNYQKEYWNRHKAPRTGHYIPILNELFKTEAEIAIENNPSAYYGSLPTDYRFYNRDTLEHISPVVIGEQQVLLLQHIESQLTAKGTRYKIIISPLFDQQKINPQDFSFLSNLFGEDNVYDFSGINEYTSDSLNYYENSHYRPKLCSELLKVVYQ